MSAFDRLLAPGPRADLLPVDAPERPPLAAPRTGANAGLRLVAFAGGFIATLVVVMAVPLALGQERAWRWWPFVISPILVLGALASYVVAERVLARRRRLAEFRWNGGRLLLAGLGIGVVAMLVCVAAVALLGGYRTDGVRAPAPGALGGLLLQAGLQAAVVEEIAFRGVLFRYLEELLGSWGALGLSAAFFGLGHLGNPGATLLGALAVAIEAGLLFGALYLLTRSLWLVMGLHFAWNVTESLLGVPVSGTERAANVIRAHFSGPTWLTGGAFGIEASVVPVLLLGGLSVWLLVLAARRRLIVRPLWARRPAPAG